MKKQTLIILVDRGYQYQHLHFTTDENIKEGDWCYEAETNIIFQAKEINLKTGLVRSIDDTFILDAVVKVVATTDSSYTSPIPYLPQPPDSFIQEYCDKGGISEVLVEYVITNRCCGRCLPYDDECVTDTTCKKHQVQGCITCYGKTGNITSIKLDSHNTITIHPIKTSWNKEEVGQFGLWLGGNLKKNKNRDISDLLEEFTKNNL